MEQKKKPRLKPRNHLIPVLMFLESGPCEETDKRTRRKAQRRKDKVELKKMAEEVFQSVAPAF